MSFTVSSLTDYTNKATELLREGVLFNDDMMNYSIQTGIKYKEPLNILDTDVYFQAGACGLGNSGDTVFTEKVITTVAYAVKKSFCIQDLQHKNLPLVPGSGLDKLASQLEVSLTDDIQAKTKLALSADLFLGTSGMIDGWYTNLSTNSISLDAVYTGVTVSSSNVINIVNNFITKITDAMRSRGVLTLHCSYAIATAYRQAVISTYNSSPVFTADGNVNEVWAFGHEGVLKIKAEAGLNGSNLMLLTWDKNLFVGMDEQSDLSSASFVYDDVTDYIWYKQYFKIGTQVAFPGEVIQNLK